MAARTVSEFALDPAETERLANLSGPFDSHLRMIELRLGVEIANRGNVFRVTGEDKAVLAAERVLKTLFDDAENETLTAQDIHLRLGNGGAERLVDPGYLPQDIAIKVKRGVIRGRGPNQAKYLHAIATHDINFGIGPAGTGKTYLAMALALRELLEKRVKRIVLTRPAIEAGERLGFLPGTMEDKVSPYLRPLYDALHDMLDFDRAQQLMERGILEIAPIAFMRGRTLNDSFVILDEAQNTTSEQMKMFLTRLGFESKAVVTGDITQIDLPDRRRSGLTEAEALLKDVDGIGFCYFTEVDVVRHPLVAKIIRAYDRKPQDTPVDKVNTQRPDK
jgi:phosphate starvation-inducible PhoH-like protein